MNYKYIEQLLERYWECQTTLEEEAILRTFFAQADIPASLLPYRDLFLAEEEMAGERLSDDFDQRILEQIGVETEERKRASSALTAHLSPITPYMRLRPFLRAAAVVAVVLTIGMAAQQGFQHTGDDPYTTPMLASGEQGDTIRLFTDMPEPLENAEAVLTPTAADTLAPANVIK